MPTMNTCGLGQLIVRLRYAWPVPDSIDLTGHNMAVREELTHRIRAVRVAMDDLYNELERNDAL